MGTRTYAPTMRVLAAVGVRGNHVAPGFVATPGLASQMGIEADEVDRRAVDRRIGLAEEIAGVVQFLAIPAASFPDGGTVSAAGKPGVPETPCGSLDVEWGGLCRAGP